MDYDRTNLPDTYDRGRDHGPQLFDAWMPKLEAHAGDLRVGRILDLGCGTGRFSGPLAARFDADVVGLDPSARMLEHARAKRRDSRTQYARGSAERVPLAAGSVDLIFASMSFHHFMDRQRAAAECRRVLRTPGCVFIRTGTREAIPDYAYVPFFPTSLPILEEVLPSHAQVRAPFEAEGFQLVACETITQTIAADYGVYADKLAAGGDSVLARLDAEDLRRGLDAIGAHARRSSPEPVREPIDLFVFR